VWKGSRPFWIFICPDKDFKRFGLSHRFQRVRLSSGKDPDWSEDCSFWCLSHPDWYLMDFGFSFGFAICILPLKSNARQICFFAPATAPQAALFVRSSGHCMFIVGVLGVRSPVVARSSLDTVALLKPKSTSIVSGVANVPGGRLKRMYREWLIRDRIRIYSLPYVIRLRRFLFGSRFLHGCRDGLVCLSLVSIR
jgi:hypothetical protein